MVIGGYALAFLGRVRATLDIDIAVDVKSRELRNLIELLERNQFRTSFSNPKNPLFLVTDEIEGVEIKVWRKLDGIKIDKEVVRRRLKKQTYNGSSLWIIGPEDFIVNKLARLHRRAVDEADVITVLKKHENNLDYDYLYKRAKQANVLALLKSIQSRI